MDGVGISRLIFFAFLATAAVQDFKEKQVKIWVFVLFGVLALGVLLLRLFVWREGGDDFGWQDPLKSCCVGIGLLGLGRISRGEIGAGDGLFFLISGFLLGFRENLLMLWGGVMLCGLYAMGSFVWHRISKGADVGKKTVPFLPFVAVWGACMAAARFLEK